MEDAATLGSADPISAYSSSPTLLSLDACEERIAELLRLCASVCAGLSEVTAEAAAQVAADAREFHYSLRLIYASILAHIRAHAGEVHLHSATATGGSTAQAAGGGAGSAGATAAAAREYRRNVYLDAQQMAVMLESLDVVKERIQHAQAVQQTLLAQADGTSADAATAVQR